MALLGVAALWLQRVLCRRCQVLLRRSIGLRRLFRGLRLRSAPRSLALVVGPYLCLQLLRELNLHGLCLIYFLRRLSALALAFRLLLFAQSLWAMAEGLGIDFLQWRVWIGIWLSVIAVVVAAFQGSVYVRYFSKFTKDIF